MYLMNHWKICRDYVENVIPKYMIKNYRHTIGDRLQLDLPVIQYLMKYYSGKETGKL